MNKATIGLLAFLCIATTSYAGEQVLSVDTNRIITLSMAAIADAGLDLDPSKLEFSSIKYTIDADQAENFSASFRHSPESESTTDETKRAMRTKTIFKVVTVTMDKSGKILSVSNTGTAHQIKIESTNLKTVQPTSPGDVLKAAPEK